MLINLTPEHWARAAMLGEARRRTNEASRHQSRDRGRDKNILGDLMGSLGELIALEHYQPRMSPDQAVETRQHMLHLGNGRSVKGADIELPNLSIDVKTFDCDRRKRFFAINAAKHQQLAGQCDGYFALLAPKYAQMAMLIDYIPHQEVSQWECKGLGKYGDPSYNCPITAFVNRYAAQSEYRALLHVECYAREQIGQAIHHPSIRQQFAHDFPHSQTLLFRAA